jgi:hypothetical protein
LPKVEWSIGLAKSLSFILLGRSREEVRILVVTNQLANIVGLPKIETLTVVNIGCYGTAPYVTIKPLIHIVYSILRSRSEDTTWRQLKKNITIKRR